MLYSINLIAIIVPIFIVQYGLSLFCLIKLVFLNQPIQKFLLWNFFILIVVGVGIITFLICYCFFRDRVFPPQPTAEQVKKDEQGQADTDGEKKHEQEPVQENTKNE